MDGLLTPLQTTRKVKGIKEKFENLSLTNENSLTEVSTTKLKRNGTSPEKKPEDSVSHTRSHKKQDSTAFLEQSYLQRGEPTVPLEDDAREILKSQPDDEDFFAVLQYLYFGIDGKHDFNVCASSAKASQILNVLVTSTIPDRWSTISAKPISRHDAQIKEMLLSCLTCLAGIGAITAQIKKLSKTQATSRSASLLRRDTVSVLDAVVSGNGLVYKMLRQIVDYHKKPMQCVVLWQELTALLAGSKVLSAVAEATLEHEKVLWLGKVNEYCQWLAKNIAYASSKTLANETETHKMLAILLKRSMSLGYSETVVEEIYMTLLLGQKALWTPLNQLLSNLSWLDQRTFLYTMLRNLSRKYLSVDPSANNDKNIGGVAAILSGLVQVNQFLEDCLVEWLSDTESESAGLGLDLRIAVIEVLAEKEEKLKVILSTSMRAFSDKLRIRHASMLQQEATAQVILLVVGKLNRMNSNSISDVTRSSQYLQAVSNRLSATLLRARFLGMIIGTAISRLVDAPDKTMSFDIEDMQGDEAKTWLELVDAKDYIGTLEDLKSSKSSVRTKPAVVSTATSTQKNVSPANKTHGNKTTKIISIEEVEDEDEADDGDGLVPYEKPDDDPSDSDEDPTLINRTKPSAPVYIINLIKMLQTDGKPEVAELALKTAPDLIRRKADFGSELSENMDSLGSALINLQEGMSEEGLQQLRIQSLIACLVALPAKMGPWLASLYFEGDFNMQQHATLLAVIGLGARELAGYKDGPGLGKPDGPTFPSKRLPEKLAAIYAPVNSLAKQIEHETLQPMALAAADKVTGPDILKVRTFSSRLDVEKKAAQKAKERKTKIPKDLHKTLVESIYLPLCCRMSLLLSSRPNTSTSILESSTLRLFLQTLMIVFTTIGPHALQLPTITRETLLLLTNLHIIGALSTDAAVLPALLQLLLTVLDVNISAGPIAEERLVTDFGNMIGELTAWAGNLNNMISVPEENDGLSWTVLAAGCQVKWHEVTRKFQGRMIGLAGSDLDNF